MVCARLLLLPIFLSVFSFGALAEVKGACYADSKEESAKINGFTIRVFRHPQADQPRSLDDCRAEIKDASGKLIFSSEDHGLAILPVSGADINDDGEPDAVIEGYTGGAHCCWDYWIVSLGKRPGLLTHLYNERDASFTKTNEGWILIETLDGRFDYFDGLSHAATPFPSVFLRLKGNYLEEISPKYWQAYQRQINGARNKLEPTDIEGFRKLGRKYPGAEGVEELVLSIVLADLYGGRPEEAWKALDKFWSRADIPRIRRLILKTHGNGLANRRD